jgi:hypothetical protein
VYAVWEFDKQLILNEVPVTQGDRTLFAHIHRRKVVVWNLKFAFSFAISSAEGSIFYVRALLF